MQPVVEKPALPADVHTLVQQLQAVFQQFGYRINRMLPVDGSEPIEADVNTSLSLFVTNLNNGTANATRIALTSGDAQVALFVSGSGRTTAIVTGGPTGASAALRTLEAIPLSLATSNTERLRLLSGGISDYADDAAASAGGVPINGIYRTGSILKVRVT